MKTELLILVDNRTEMPELRQEHGLSILVSGGNGKLLFDAAAHGQTLCQNAQILGIDFGKVDTAVVSHGHYDHTGGLADLAEARPGIKLFAHPGIFAQRWSEKPGRQLKDVSCSHPHRMLVDRGVNFQPVNAPQQLNDDIILSGPIGGKNDTGGFVVRKNEELLPDTFEDESLLLVRGVNGWAMLTGCCHRGLKNSLRTAQFLTRGEPISAIVGGLHLHNAATEKLDEAIVLLEQTGNPMLYPGHCTGDNAIEYLREKLGDTVCPLHAGMTIYL